MTEAGDRPERLLASLGVASRREIARWVDAGRLAADGHVLKGGERIKPSARLTLDGRRLVLPEARAEHRVLMYHKPAGEIVTRRDPRGRPSVFAALPRIEGGRWIAVGRLDIATTGLLLFTSDGALAARLMHPRGGFERRYLVRVHGALEEAGRRQLIGGVTLEDGPARLLDCRPLSRSGASREASNRWYRVSLAEGRNREVRRLFEAVGVEVSRLKRVGFGPVELPRDLAPGAWRELPRADARALARLSRQPRTEAAAKPGVQSL